MLITAKGLRKNVGRTIFFEEIPEHPVHGILGETEEGFRCKTERRSYQIRTGSRVGLYRRSDGARIIYHVNLMNLL
jgi:hypothetical protein